MPNHGGLIVDGDKLTPIGDTFIITTKDIDILQKDLDIILEEIITPDGKRKVICTNTKCMNSEKGCKNKLRLLTEE